MKLSFEQHFMTPVELANSIPKKVSQPAPSPMRIESTGGDIPLGQILLYAGLTIGAIYLAIKIYENNQRNKERDRLYY
jgi:hypothetical protein